MLGYLFRGRRVVLARGHPQPHDRGCGRHDLVRDLVDARRLEREDVDRRLRERAIRDRAGSEQPHLRVHPRLLAELFFRDIGPRPGERVQAVDGQFAVVGVQRREHPRQRHHRVGERPAERPGVHGLRQHVDADGDRGRPRMLVPIVGAPVRALPPSATIATSARSRSACPTDQVGQVLGGALLLALHDDLDRHRRSAVGEERPDRRGMDRDPALVVGGAAAVHAPVPHDGLERRHVPQLRIGRRLDVVVGVQQHGRGSRRPSICPKTAG